MMKKKLLAAVLALCMLLGLLPTTAWAAGTITTISSAADLKALAEEVNGGNEYRNKTVTLTADIDLGGSEDNPWTPIGTDFYTSFKGTFDGGGHKITGLYFNNAEGNQGLFGHISSPGKVKNLSVSGTVTGGRYVGGVVGSNYGVVTGCCYTGKVAGSDYVGGVVGYNNGNCTVEKCYNTGTVTGTGEYAQVGGVVGTNYGKVENCYSTGAVTGSAANARVGGVVGFIDNNGSVRNCYNAGTVTGRAASARVGGVVGNKGPNNLAENCYFLTGKGAEHSIGSDANSAAGITADAFKEQTTFADWDFTSIWEMSQTLDRPILVDNREPAHSTHSWTTAWTANDTHHWHECTGWGTCDVTDNTQKNGYDVHSGGTATCTAQAVCDACNQEYGSLDSSNHANLTHNDSVAATCTAYGVKEYWTCSGCGKHFSDANGTTEIANLDTWKNGDGKIEKAEHDFTGNYLSDASGHWHKCQNCTATDTKANHGWESDTDTTCNTCGYTRTVHTHQYGAWTSDAANHWHQCTAADCPDLESSRKDSAAHTEDSGTVTKPATNTEKGVRTYQCSVCQRILRTEEIPMLTEPTHSISGTVTDKDDNTVSGATVKLMQGNTEVAKTTTSGGAYSFTGVKAGTYNVVAEQGSGGDTITKTILVVLTDADATEKNIKMPDGKKNSVVEVTGDDTPAVVVGGVDEIAEAQPVSSGETVTVKLTVEKKAESAADKATEIKQVASGKTLDFLDLSLVKTVTPSSGDSTDTPITDTNGKVLEIVVPYDFSGKQNVTVYRYHGGSAEALNEAKGDAKTGGTFQVRTDSVIIYATKFSTYAIGYTPEGTPEPERPSGGGGGGGGSATYPPTVEESEHGKVTVSPRQPARGDKVTVTLTPDSGYQPDGVTVTDRNGKPVAVTDSGGGTYTFIQPNGKATISARFKADGGYGSCPKNHTCPVARFPDTYPTAWYHDGVHYCLEHSLMEGYDTGLFGPGDHLSRAHLVQMLYNQAGRPDMTEESSFEDVAPGAWYAKAVAWAQQSGIVSGYDSRRFHPDGWITREQLAAILWRYAGSPAATGLALDFTDAGDVSDYAVGALRWAVDWEIIYGKDGGILDPTGLATRAEAAAMLMRYGTNIT